MVSIILLFLQEFPPILKMGKRLTKYIILLSYLSLYYKYLKFFLIHLSYYINLIGRIFNIPLNGKYIAQGIMGIPFVKYMNSLRFEVFKSFRNFFSLHFLACGLVLGLGPSYAQTNRLFRLELTTEVREDCSWGQKKELQNAGADAKIHIYVLPQLVARSLFAQQFSGLFFFIEGVSMLFNRLTNCLLSLSPASTFNVIVRRIRG